jgi:hypothetical protein
MPSILDKNLERIQSILKRNDWDYKDVIVLMHSFRQILEINNTKPKYKYINLYSNWVFHAKITENQVAMAILDILTDSMISHNANPTKRKWINDAIIEGLSLHLLRKEILSFSKDYNVGKDINIYKFNNWKNFVSSLIEELLDKPLKVDENKNKEIYSKLIGKAKESGYIGNAVLGISFLINNNGVVYWKIDTPETLRKGVTVIGPMSIISKQMVDDYSNK